MVFHARPEELKACKSAILKNISVDVVGRVGSGRSKLLKAIAVELLDAGRKVITISGYPATSHMPLRALELAGFGTALGQSDTATSNDPASALIASVSGYPSVLIVDDAHFLDDDSWTVLASIHAETKTPLVISRANFAADTASPSERSIPSITPSGIMLKLGPLTFEATTALLLHRLGGPAELDVLSNIYRLSGGIPSLVTAIADAATMSGRLTPRDGVWSMSGEFWDEKLTGSVKYLLQGLTRSQLDLIDALGIHGALDLTIAVDLIGEEDLESLEAAETIAIVSTDAHPKVALDPPLIGEWVRHEPTSLRRRRVTEALRGKLPVSNFSSTTANSRVDSALSTANSALSGAVADERMARLTAARDSWAKQLSFTSGLALLTELHSFPANPDEIEAVYAQMRENNDDSPRDRARFRQLRMRWLAYRLDRATEAIELAHTIPPALLPYSEYLLAVALQIQIDMCGIPDDVDDQLANMRRPDQAISGWAEVTASYVCIVQGKPVSALGILNQMTPPPHSELASAHELMHLWARMGNGEVTWGFERSMKLLNRALERFDLPLTHAYALPAATCLQAVGHYGAGESLLGAVLTLGPPAVGQERTHVALLSYAAVFSSLGGHFSLAESLTKEAERPQLSPCPLPAATSSVARANLHHLAGDRAAALQSLRQSFDQLTQLGYVLSAVDGALICSALMRTGDLLPEVYPLLPAMEGSWRTHFLGYIMAMAQSDVPALESSTNHLIEAGRLASAQYCAAELRRLCLANQDEAGIRRADSLTERIVRLRDDIDVSAANWLHGKHFQVTAGLSDREKEITRLAAKGLSNPAIAEHLTISFRTVEAHLSHAYRKLGIRNRADLLDLNWDWNS